MQKERDETLWERLEPLLLRVQRPSRYIGGEWNAPPVSPGGVEVVLAYPDVYEIGTSNLGLAILREVINDIEGASCERVYSPWTDMEGEMREAALPLFSLETHRPVSMFDIFGISIPHELNYTNIVNLIDLAGLPLRTADRTRGPLILGGGCGAANPEPLADFFDLIVLGEAEEVIGSLVSVVARAKSAGWSREKVLAEAASLEGVYRPSNYSVSYESDGVISRIKPEPGVPDRVRKRLVDLDKWPYPSRPLVPFCEAVHDRLNVEVFRGCTRGCRFCQAGMIYRPVRERSPDGVIELVELGSAASGYDEVSLCSLSSTDYTQVEDVSARVSRICSERRMSLTLPSLRMDGLSVELVSGLSAGKGGGFTFAPEAGTERLRAVINKPISEKDMAEAILGSVRAGRRRVKLYFMIGIPTETDEDVEAIGRLIHGFREIVRSAGLAPPAFNVSVSTFVPKPHTPFQWAAAERPDSIERKQEILKSTVRGRGINLSWHDRDMSLIEELLARGDRRLATVVQDVWESGGRFESWSELFDPTLWENALERAGLAADFYVHRERVEREVLPWDHLDFGLDKSFLYREYVRALEGASTPDCRTGECTECGVCDALDTKPVMQGAWR